MSHATRFSSQPRLCVTLTVVYLQIHVKAEKCWPHSANFSWLCATGAGLAQGAPFLARGTQYMHNSSRSHGDPLSSQPQLDLSTESTLP